MTGDVDIGEWAKDAFARDELSVDALEQVMAAALRTAPAAKRRRGAGWLVPWVVLGLLATMWHVALLAGMLNSRHPTIQGVLMAQVGLVVWDSMLGACVWAFQSEL